MSVFLRFLPVILLFIGASHTQATETITRMERMLPNDTLIFVSFKNVPQSIERWNRLGFRSPLANPALQAVISRVEEHFPQSWMDASFDWSQLSTLPTGEACMAIVEAVPGKPAIVIGMDVRGHHEESIAFFDRLGRGLPPKQNLSHEETIGKTRIVQYSNLAYFLKDDLLVAATDPEVAKRLLRSWPGSKGIVESEAYRAVIEQCKADAEKIEPDVCCFLRPIQLLATRMTLKKPKPPMTWQDYLKQAKMTGFDAIRGIGGACWFGRDSHALLYRVGVYAPDRAGWVMKMLRMPNRQEHEPPSWVPGNVAAFGDFYWEMQQAFQPFCKVFSFGLDKETWEEDLFEEVLNVLRDDASGPQIDIRKEFVQRLGERVLVFRGVQKSDESIWQHTVVGLKIADEAAVAKSLEKYLRYNGEGDIRISIIEHKISGSILYEVGERIGEKSSVANAPEISFGDTSPRPRKKTLLEEREEKPEERQADRPVYIGVSHGYLWWGNDGDLLKSLLTAGSPLAQDADYLAVQRELEKLTTAPVSFRSFARRGDEFGLLARCMDTQKFFTPFLLEAQERDVSEPAVGRKKATDLRAAEVAVGPAGWFAESLSNGWRIVGVVLKPKPSSIFDQ